MLELLLGAEFLSVGEAHALLQPHLRRAESAHTSELPPAPLSGTSEAQPPPEPNRNAPRQSTPQLPAHTPDAPTATPLPASALTAASSTRTADGISAHSSLHSTDEGVSANGSMTNPYHQPHVGRDPFADRGVGRAETKPACGPLTPTLAPLLAPDATFYEPTVSGEPSLDGDEGNHILLRTSSQRCTPHETL